MKFIWFVNLGKEPCNLLSFFFLTVSLFCVPQHLADDRLVGIHIIYHMNELEINCQQWGEGIQIIIITIIFKKEET